MIWADTYIQTTISDATKNVFSVSVPQNDEDYLCPMSHNKAACPDSEWCW